MTGSLAWRFFDLDLWLVGAAHFVILCASFQVPYRLRWKQDLQQLMPFNRKLLWVQSGFTVLTIIAFGTLTLVLHTELLRGDRAALGLAHSRGRSLFFARRLARGNSVCGGAYPPDTSVLRACGELSGAVRVAHVPKRQRLIGENQFRTRHKSSQPADL